MTEHIPVTPTPGTITLFNSNGRLTKKRLKEVLAEHPNAEFRNLSSFHGGEYVSGKAAAKGDLALEVMDQHSKLVGVVTFEMQSGGKVKATVR